MTFCIGRREFITLLGGAGPRGRLRYANRLGRATLAQRPTLN